MNATRIIIATAMAFAFAGPALAAPIATGFDSTSLGRTDDGYSQPVNIGFDVNFFGNTYSTLYVSNNGYVTFGAGQGYYSPVGLGAGYVGNPIIAPFYDDVDTRNGASGVTAYGGGTYAGHDAFGVTWPGVGYYSSAADKLDAFQLILVDRSDTGLGNFDIHFNYGSIQWDSAMTTQSAAVGFNAANGAVGSFFEAPGSLVHGAFVDGGADALNGSSFTFAARSGAAVLVPVAAVPEPETFALLGLGIGAALVARRRKDRDAGSLSMAMA